MKKRKSPLEKTVNAMLSEYIKKQYPKLIFRVDLAADINLTIGQATRHKALQMEERGYPDIFIAKAKKGYNGMYIELKRDITEVYKKDGTFRRKVNKKTGKCHIQEQHEMHERLRKEGYYVVWGFGFDNAKLKLDEYLKG